MRPLVVGTWGWLAAQTCGMTEKRRCLEAILALEPGNQWATSAMAWVKEQEHVIKAEDGSTITSVTTGGGAYVEGTVPTQSTGTRKPLKTDATGSSDAVECWL